MGQPKLRIGNHRKVTTAENIWHVCRRFPKNFLYPPKKMYFLSYHFCLLRQYNTTKRRHFLYRSELSH